MARWRQAIRRLGRTPTFTLTVIVSLALGIGANTAMFTLAEALLLRTIPVRQPERLVRIASDTGLGGAPGSILHALADLIQGERLFDGVCGFLSPASTVRLNGRVTRMAGHAMTGPCFDTLGIRAMMGRPLTEDDDRPDAAKVVVLAYDAWMREFGGNPAVIGQAMQIESATFTIVGVAERGFTGLMIGYPEKFFMPFTHFDLGMDTPPRSMLPVEVFARLRPESTKEQVAARLTALWPHFLEASVPVAYTGAMRDRYLSLRLLVSDAATGIDYSLRPRFRGPLLALLAISGILLVATCVNVGTLLLARATERRREAAIRMALGGSRWNVASDVLVESAWLLGTGAVAGLLVSFWVDRVLVSLFSASTASFALDVAPNGRVLAFTGLIATLAFTAFTIVATLAARRVSATDVGSASPRVVGHRDRLRQAAVVVQVALTMVLAAVGSAFVEELRGLQAAPLGLTLDHVLMAQLSPVPGGYQAPFVRGPYFRDLLERITGIPGVRSVAFANSPLLGAPLVFTPAAVVGSDRSVVPAESMFVSDQFFSTLGIPLTAGSSFDGPGKPADTRRTAILSEAAARALFGRVPVVGRRIRLGSNPLNEPLDVVGVAADAVMSSPQRHNVNVVYLNFWEWGNTQGWASLMVRTDDDAAAVRSPIERTVAGAGHEFIPSIRTLSDQHHVALAQERLLATVSSAFGALGLVLVVVGVHGLLSFSVARRVREIGILMALGADRRRVQWLVVRQGLVLITTGILIGLPAAWATNNVASRMIYGHEVLALGPLVMAGVVMLSAGAIAIWWPAHWAASLHPMQALRQD